MSKDQSAKGSEQQQVNRQRRAQEQAETAGAEPLPLAPGALMDLPDKASGRPLRRRAALQMQRSHGNQVVQRLLQTPPASVLQRVGPDDEEAESPTSAGPGAETETGPAANPALTDEEQRALFEQAVAAHQSGDYRTAVELFRRLMQTPNLPESALSDIRDNANLASRMLLGEASKLYERGDFRGAIEIFRFLMNQPGADSAAASDMQDNIVTAGRRMFEEASAAFERGDYEAAIAGFRAIREIPELASASGDLLDNIITASGRLFQQGVGAYADGDYEGALAAFDAVLTVEELPEEVRRDVLFNRGMALQRLGRHEEALADLEAYAAQAPTPADRAEAEARIDESLAALGAPEERGGAADEGAAADGSAAATGADGGLRTDSVPDSAGGGATGGPESAGGESPAERLQQAMDHYRGADYWGAIPLLERVRDSRDATDAQRLEAQLHIGLAYYAVTSYTFAASNMRRYQRMPGADPSLVAEQLAEAERQNQRAAR